MDVLYRNVRRVPQCSSRTAMSVPYRNVGGRPSGRPNPERTVTKPPRRSIANIPARPRHGAIKLRDMDDIDLNILKLLQEDARATNSDLADRVGLSPAPCLRRVRAL